MTPKVGPPFGNQPPAADKRNLSIVLEHLSARKKKGGPVAVKGWLASPTE